MSRGERRRAGVSGGERRRAGVSGGSREENQRWLEESRVEWGELKNYFQKVYGVYCVP